MAWTLRNLSAYYYIDPMKNKAEMVDVVKTNGKLNGLGGKNPFLIGVAGGTASGKVFHKLKYRYISNRLEAISKYVSIRPTQILYIRVTILHFYISIFSNFCYRPTHLPKIHF